MRAGPHACFLRRAGPLALYKFNVSSNPLDSCIVPWYVFNVGKGYHHTCCLSSIQGRNCFELTQSLRSAWNSPWYQAYRASIHQCGHAETCGLQCVKATPIYQGPEPRTEAQRRNLEAIYESYQLKQSFVSHYPALMILEMDVKCNLDCPHCWQKPQRDQREDAHFTLHDKQDEFKEFVRHGMVVGLIGGEPTICKDYDLACRLIKEADGARVDLTTNGHFGARVADRIELFTQICFSCDAASPATYATVRPAQHNNPKFDFDNLLRGISEVVSATERLAEKPHLLMRFTITGQNWKEMPEMVRTAHRLGVQAVEFWELFDRTYTWLTIRHNVNLHSFKTDLHSFKECFQEARQEAARLGVNLDYRLPCIGEHK